MDAIQTIFGKKKADFSKFESFGFVRARDEWQFETTLSESGFRLEVRVSDDETISAGVIDPESDEPYTLHLKSGAAGSFVGAVRSQYEETLQKIARECFVPDIFKGEQTNALIAHVKKTYGNELEFLWKKFSDNAVWRRTDTRKWYGVILTVPRKKLEGVSEEIVEILDFRIRPEEMQKVVDGKRYFPGWHMNKKRWCTVILDGTIPLEEICERLAESYALAVK